MARALIHLAAVRHGSGARAEAQSLLDRAGVIADRSLGTKHPLSLMLAELEHQLRAEDSNEG